MIELNIITNIQFGFKKMHRRDFKLCSEIETILGLERKQALVSIY